MANKNSKIWQRSQANKRNIFFSAMKLFAEHGYDNVSVDDIVREAKSSKGTFYNYFHSKDELFVFYNQALDERFYDFYQKLLESKHYGGGSALEKLYIMSMYILHVLAENGREFATISDIRQLRDEYGNSAAEDVLCNSINNIFPSLMELGKKDGSIRGDIDIPEATLLLYIYLKGAVFEWESAERAGDLEQDGAALLDFFCRSIAKLPENLPAQP